MRPNLTKTELMALLGATYAGDDAMPVDQADQLLTMLPHDILPGGMTARMVLRQFLIGLRTLKVERLLKEGYEGPLITREDFKKQVIRQLHVVDQLIPDSMLNQMMRELAGKLSSQEQVKFKRRLLMHYADFLADLSWGHLHRETYENTWKHIEIIYELSDTYGIEPVQLIQGVEDVQDVILRRMSTPDQYRDRVLAVLDSFHPDRVEELVWTHVRKLLKDFGGTDQDVDQLIVRAGKDSRDLSSYWRLRAEMIEKIVRRIERVWSTPPVTELVES